MPLPRYRCQKVVEAAKILRALRASDLGAWLTLELPGGSKVEYYAEQAWARRNVQPGEGLIMLEGGYFVRYADGYCSWSPAKVFEEGYRRVYGDDPLDG